MRWGLAVSILAVVVATALTEAPPASTLPVGGPLVGERVQTNSPWFAYSSDSLLIEAPNEVRLSNRRVNQTAPLVQLFGRKWAAENESQVERPLVLIIRIELEAHRDANITPPDVIVALRDRRGFGASGWSANASWIVLRGPTEAVIAFVFEVEAEPRDVRGISVRWGGEWRELQFVSPLK